MTSTWDSEPGDINDRSHLTYVYTTLEEMQRIFGTESGASLIDPVSARMDDDGDLSTTLDTIEQQALYDVQEEATHEINYYLCSRYEPSILTANTWVRRACSYLACYFLCQRRGDPAQFKDARDLILTRLREISNGTKNLPLASQRADDLTPAMSNLVVSDRYSRKKLRVQTPISEGGTDGSQHPEYINYFEF